MFNPVKLYLVICGNIKLSRSFFQSKSKNIVFFYPSQFIIPKLDKPAFYVFSMSLVKMLW